MSRPWLFIRQHYYAIAARKVRKILDHHEKIIRDPKFMNKTGLNNGVVELIEYFCCAAPGFIALVPNEISTSPSLILVFSKMFSGEFSPSFNYYLELILKLRNWELNPLFDAFPLRDDEIAKLKDLCSKIDEVESELSRH